MKKIVSGLLLASLATLTLEAASKPNILVMWGG